MWSILQAYCNIRCNPLIFLLEFFFRDVIHHIMCLRISSCLFWPDTFSEVHIIHNWLTRPEHRCIECICVTTHFENVSINFAYSLSFFHSHSVSTRMGSSEQQFWRRCNVLYNQIVVGQQQYPNWVPWLRYGDLFIWY